MFTADDARLMAVNSWDEMIESAVKNSPTAFSGSARIVVHWEAPEGSPPFDDRINQVVSALEERGFNVAVEGRDSYRYAEVVFDWVKPQLKDVSPTELVQRWVESWHPWDKE